MGTFMREVWGQGSATAEVLMHRLAMAAIGALLLLWVEAAPATAQPTEEPGGPALYLSDTQGARSRAVLLSTRLDVRVSGLLARATLVQSFRNDSAGWREAEYLLPLPADAAVRRLLLSVGERRIVGEIRERQDARRVYDEARRSGRRAALLEQQRPHLFTSRVANVPPGETVAVEIELVVPVTYRDGEFALRFPTTLTPVYVPGVPLRDVPADPGAGPWLPLDGSGWSPPTDRVPDAPLVSAWQYAAPGSDAAPLNPLAFDIRIDAGVPLAAVESLYHDIAIDREEARYRITPRSGPVEMDRDLVLRWRPRPAAQPRAAVFHERFDGEDFALLMVVPPVAETVQRLPRELLLVIDVSGSMQGEPIRQARSSVLHALRSLEPQDRVNVIAFNDSLRVLFAASRPATAETLAAARDFVAGLQAGGGTEMLPALRRALHEPWAEGGTAADGPVLLRQLLFVTDGAVANETELFRLIERDLGAARLYTIGIGSAPNGYFMHRAAVLGRGDALFIARPEEVAPQLDALFARLARPLARDLQVTWPFPVEAFPAAVPDLYAGQPLQQAVRIAGDYLPGAELRVSGRIAGRAWENRLTLPEGARADGVAQHWARRKLEDLLAGARRGVEREEVRAAALPLALRFSLASPFTSFVAREERPLRPALAPVGADKLPNTRPAGQAPQQFAFAQTATTGLARLYLAGLLAFGALIAYVLGRPEPRP
jgi:Ca-activated chloride channel family protein